MRFERVSDTFREPGAAHHAVAHRYGDIRMKRSQTQRQTRGRRAVRVWLGRSPRPDGEPQRELEDNKQNAGGGAGHEQNVAKDVRRIKTPTVVAVDVRRTKTLLSSMQPMNSPNRLPSLLEIVIVCGERLCASDET